mmetsp:Transcript_41453/g.120014  ORF Transcript_41453/g.120014 Transcript_41453/m.120014 type:complete len:388 (+) Transcript_41453:2706-3869(+)
MFRAEEEVPRDQGKNRAPPGLAAGHHWPAQRQGVAQVLLGVQDPGRMEALAGPARVQVVTRRHHPRAGADSACVGEEANAKVEEGSQGGWRPHGKVPESRGAGIGAAPAERGAGGNPAAVAEREEVVDQQDQAVGGEHRRRAAKPLRGQGESRGGRQARRGHLEAGCGDREGGGDEETHRGAGRGAHAHSDGNRAGQNGFEGAAGEVPGRGGPVPTAPQEHSNAVDRRHEHGRQHAADEHGGGTCPRFQDEPQCQHPARRRSWGWQDVAPGNLDQRAGSRSAVEVHGGESEPHVPPSARDRRQAVEAFGLFWQLTGPALGQGVVRQIALGDRCLRFVKPAVLELRLGPHARSARRGREGRPLREQVVYGPGEVRRSRCYVGQGRRGA